jgi:16S rRNA (uracil1498-N3)-methyltransferase
VKTTDKKIHRFLIDTIPDENEFEITDIRLVHQLVHVLRMSKDDSLILFTDRGPDVLVDVLSIEKKSIVVKVQSILPSTPSPNRAVTACISIIRKERFEIAVEKLTELGVSAIVPVLSHRTVRQGIKAERLQIISDEALEQCGGNTRVKIYPPCTLEESLASFTDTAIVFKQNGAVLNSASLPENVTIYIGPEGGWSIEDEELFKKYNALEYSLGNRVLRTETASIVASYKLLWE